MTWLRHRWLPLLILVTATTALIGSIAVTASRDSGWWPGAMMGSVVRREGPVRSVEDAEQTADRFGQLWGLHVGEVMQFDNAPPAEQPGWSTGRR